MNLVDNQLIVTVVEASSKYLQIGFPDLILELDIFLRICYKDDPHFPLGASQALSTALTQLAPSLLHALLLGITKSYDKRSIAKTTDLFARLYQVNSSPQIIQDLIAQLPESGFSQGEKEKLWKSFCDALSDRDTRKLRHVLIFFNSNCKRKIQ